MTKQLRENDIRPQNLMSRQRKYLQEDLKYLKKQKSNFVEINCPACGSKLVKSKFKKYSFNYNQCLKCKTVFMSPRPTPAIIFDYLKSSKNYQYWNKVIFPASEKIRRRKIFKPRVTRVLQICQKFKVPTRNLVEVGSGFGTFLEEMILRGNFKSVVGIEPSLSWAETCRAKGIKIISQPIEKILPNKLEVDVVVSFEVIEHIFSPQEFIKACHKILKKNGLLIITCPNINGFDIRLLGKKSDTVDAEHINYFNPDSLGLLLEKQGFRVLEKQTPGVLDIDLVRNKILSGKFELEDGFLRDIIMESTTKTRNSFQKFLQKNLFSSNMLLTAQKIN